MRALAGLWLLAFGLAGCATLPPTEQTPFLPAGVFGVYQDNDTGAINHAAWAFASPANTRNNPVDAAKAVVALEYLSGELRENPRWIGIDSTIDTHIGRARDQLRDILGIRADAPPQTVVNALLALSWDLRVGNQEAVMRVLASPLFTRPPAQTLQILANLPYVQEANIATTQAANESSPDGGWRG